MVTPVGSAQQTINMLPGQSASAYVMAVPSQESQLEELQSSLINQAQAASQIPWYKNFLGIASTIILLALGLRFHGNNQAKKYLKQFEGAKTTISEYLKKAEKSRKISFHELTTQAKDIVKDYKGKSKEDLIAQLKSILEPLYSSINLPKNLARYYEDNQGNIALFLDCPEEITSKGSIIQLKRRAVLPNGKSFQTSQIVSLEAFNSEGIYSNKDLKQNNGTSWTPIKNRKPIQLKDDGSFSNVFGVFRSISYFINMSLGLAKNHKNILKSLKTA